MLTNISINSILNLTSILFFLGLLGVILNRKNILTILMSIEILLLAVNLNFAALSIYLDDIIGHIFCNFHFDYSRSGIRYRFSYYYTIL